MATAAKPVAPPAEEPMICEPTEQAVPEAKTVVVEAPKKKKKKKKASYKDMMKSLTASAERDADKEKEQLRKVTGGGTFSKIDKI